MLQPPTPFRNIRSWFRRRPLQAQGYRYVFFDAKHGYTCHRRGRGGHGKKNKGALLVAWGLRHNRREELIDFRAVDRGQR